MASTVFAVDAEEPLSVEEVQAYFRIRPLSVAEVTAGCVVDWRSGLEKWVKGVGG